MFSRSPRERPRHSAGASRAERSHWIEGALTAVRPTPEVVLDIELDEVAPPVRVHRSRLALAIAVTVATLPILVIDNLPATAEADDAQVATAVSADAILEQPSTTAAPTTSTTLAPTSTAAPGAPSTEAPATTAEAVSAQTVHTHPAPTTTVAPPPPAPTTTRPPAPSAGDPNDPATWDNLAQCEASGNWAMNSGNGYYGGLQFSLGSWSSVGGGGYPHQATKAEQINRGRILLAQGGWGQWPSCARALGYL